MTFARENLKQQREECLYTHISCMEMPPNTQRTSEEWWQGEETQLQSEVAALTGFCADVIITNATWAVNQQHSVKIIVINVA